MQPSTALDPPDSPLPAPRNETALASEDFATALMYFLRYHPMR